MGKKINQNCNHVSLINFSKPISGFKMFLTLHLEELFTSLDNVGHTGLLISHFQLQLSSLYWQNVWRHREIKSCTFKRLCIQKKRVAVLYTYFNDKVALFTLIFEEFRQKKKANHRMIKCPSEITDKYNVFANFNTEFKFSLLTF